VPPSQAPRLGPHTLAVYYAQIPFDPAKTIASVTLPRNPLLQLFDLGVPAPASYPSVSSAYDDTGLAPAAAPRDGNYDGGGDSYDGSRVTWLNAPSGKKEDRLPARAAEHNAVLPRGDGKEEVSETCTVITTLLDHQAAPADAVRETYLTRWSASETTFGEDKATITGAGDRTSGPVLRSGSPRLVIQEAWAWLTGAQLVRASAAAALRSETAAARALRRRDSALVTADEESFTAAWHHAVRSMTSTRVTASSSLQALAAAADAAARAALHTLNVPGRQRHSERAQKARPKFPHATATKTTVTGKPEVTVFAPGFC
jgi:hypothetical protein